jgi:hypothetical protein
VLRGEAGLGGRGNAAGPLGAAGAALSLDSLEEQVVSMLPVALTHRKILNRNLVLPSILPSTLPLHPHLHPPLPPPSPSPSPSLSPPARPLLQVASGLITAARYHELIHAEAVSSGPSRPLPPRERRAAPPTLRQYNLDMGGGQSATLTTNFGSPDPGDSRRDWSREWESRGRGGRGGRGRGRPAPSAPRTELK